MSSCQTLFAGAGRSDITPPVGSPHLNWGASKHEVAAGIDLELYSTAVYLSDGATDVVLVNLDVATLPEPMAVDLRSRISKATGVPAARVYLTWVHTHSGVLLHDTPWMRTGREQFLEYTGRFTERAAQAASEAKNNAVPARIGWGKGSSDLGINRRQHLPDGRVVTGNNPAGPVDREVIVVRIDDVSGKPLATLVNFAMHPTIAGPDNDKITPDYPGAMKRVVEQNLGGLSCFLQGATGDIGPIEGFTGDVNVYRRTGARLGYEVCRIAEGIRTEGGDLEFRGVLESGAPLGIFRWTPRRDEAATIRTGSTVARLAPHPVAPVEELRRNYLAVEQKLHALQQAGETARIPEVHFQAKRAALQLQRAERLADPANVEIPVQGIAVGDVAIVLTPLEPFCEIGMNVKKRSPFPATMFCGYSLGGYFLCYLPTDQALDEGGYETGISLFGKSSAQRLEDSAVQLLEQLHG